MKVHILPSAKRDLERGILFYERQQEGLGRYFLDSIAVDIGSIESLGGIHPLRKNHHRFLSKRFPYWIYYRTDRDIAYIVAVLDARQDPSKILRRERQEEFRNVLKS